MQILTMDSFIVNMTDSLLATKLNRNNLLTYLFAGEVFFIVCDEVFFC